MVGGRGFNKRSKDLVCYCDVFIGYLGNCFAGCGFMLLSLSGTWSQNWVLDRRWQGRFCLSLVFVFVELDFVMFGFLVGLVLLVLN